MSLAAAEEIACPHCGVGVAYPIEIAPTGIKFKCFACGAGFAQAASAADEAGNTLVTDQLSTPTAQGSVAPGNLTHDGEHPGYASPSKNVDAGPAIVPGPTDKPTPTSGGGPTPDTHDELDALAVKQGTLNYPWDGSVAEKQAAIEAAS